MRIRIKIPASSANLGCGFDAFGLALALYTDFVFDTNTAIEAPPLSVRGDGAEKLLEEFGFTVDNVVKRAKAVLAG